MHLRFCSALVGFALIVPLGCSSSQEEATTPEQPAPAGAEAQPTGGASDEDVTQPGTQPQQAPGSNQPASAKGGVL